MDKLKMLFLSSFYSLSTALYCVICKSSELCLKIWSAFHREGSSYEGPKVKYFSWKQALWLLKEEDILKASKNQRKPKPRIRFRSKPITACKTINVIQRLEPGKFARILLKKSILELLKHASRKHNFTVNFWKLRWDFVGRFDSHKCFVYQVGVASYW